MNKELYRRIDEITHYIWDPIGVAGEPNARDEYFDYLPEIYNIVERGDEAQLAEYLDKLARVTMGLSIISTERTQEAITAMFAWKDQFDDPL